MLYTIDRLLFDGHYALTPPLHSLYVLDHSTEYGECRSTVGHMESRRRDRPAEYVLFSQIIARSQSQLYSAKSFLRVLKR